MVILCTLKLISDLQVTLSMVLDLYRTFATHFF